MGLLDAIGAQDAPYLPYLNTGTMFDLSMGSFVAGVDNHYILNGGLAATNAVIGKPQVFKSTLANGFIVNVLARYPGSEGYINDTEFALGNKPRIIEMVNLYYDDPVERARVLEKMDQDLRVTNPIEHDLESFMEKLKEISAFKQKHAKDYTVEIPILDPKTGKPQRMMIPTLASVDSLTEAKVKASTDMLEKHSASSSETNTVFMRDGLVKMKLMELVPSMAVRAGIYFMFTAQVGNSIDMSGSYGPPPKEMQYMKQGEKVKGVGSRFMFLISNVLEARSATVMIDKEKECEYPLPSGITGETEMSQITAILTRCKNRNAGTKFLPVMSQSQGLETGLTNYDYLRKNGYFGLAGNDRNHQPMLLPDVNLTRKTASTKLMDYKTSRAVEILSQFCYVLNSWTIRDDIGHYRMTPEQLAEKLMKDSGYAMDDILNSRGWWTYGDHPRSYLSLFDVLDIACGNYRPKLIAVAPTPTKKK